MDYSRFFPDVVTKALKHEPPGAWMPKIPAGCIRLSAGYPSPSLVPWTQIGEMAQQLLNDEHDLPLQYTGSRGMDSLRTHVQQRLLQRDIHVSEHTLLVTSGAAQAIDLIARTLLDQATTMVVEGPTYMEALEIFRNYTDQIFDVPVDSDGLRTDALEEWLQQRTQAELSMPRFVYTIPSFHNPTGVTLSFERRRRLLELAEQFNFLIVEDDAYGELFFDEAPVPLKSMDETGRVIHVGSLSKVVAPGLRIGWVVGPEPLVTTFGWFKKDLDHPFAEATTATYLNGIHLVDRLSVLRTAYRDRRDLMISTLERCMPEAVTWKEPNGGFFVWLHVPAVDTAKLLPKALEAGVSYVPGRHFFCQPHDGLEYLRLSYSYLEAELLVQGVERLAELLRGEMRA